MGPKELIHSGITDLVIKAFYWVYNGLGYGFLEKVYENATALKLRQWGLTVEQQVNVYFEGVEVGQYFADLMVAGSVIVEVKAVQDINPAHEAQLVNYLKATNMKVGMLLNFGLKAEFRRKVFFVDRDQGGNRN